MNSLYIVASLLGTVLVFWGSKVLHRRYSFTLLSPILVCPLVLVALLLVTRTSYQDYTSGADALSWMLKPATVAFAIPMYKHFHLIRKHAVEFLSSVVVGSLVAIVTSAVFAVWAHLNAQTIDSLVPRSVTTPVAMDISATLGGIPTLTAVFVIVTGVTGLLVGPYAIRCLPIRTAIAKGLFFGVAAHGAGTSKAFELGELEGTFSSLGMITTAGASLLFAPLMQGLIY